MGVLIVVAAKLALLLNNPELLQTLAEAHEKAGRWQEAHEGYNWARTAPFRFATCGSCVGSWRLHRHLAQARCLARLGRRAEALAIIDGKKLQGEHLITPWAIRAIVETAYGTPREAEFRERMSKVKGRQYYSESAAGAYFDLYKAELEGNVEAIIDTMVSVLPKRPRHEATLQTAGWVGDEARVCLARMPDKAIPILKKRAISGGKGSDTALWALESMGQ
jgi:hypothetical protein